MSNNLVTTHNCKPGMLVWYSPSPGYAFAGVVESEPWKLGEHTWVVHLRDMESGYGKFRGTPERTTVKAAALTALRMRVTAESKAQGGGT